MPFKGDMRLGGARRNDSTLNGMTEGPSYPAAGTVLLVLSGVEYPIVHGGASVNISEDEANPDYRPSQKANFNSVADGIGGQYVDYANPSNVQYYPYPTIIVYNVSTSGSYLYFDVDGYYYQNGTNINSKVHDGYGGWSTYSQTNYDPPSQFASFSETIMAELDGNSYPVGSGTRVYSHNGTGGYESVLNNVNYVNSGDVIGSATSPWTSPLPDGNYYTGGTVTSDVLSNGSGGAIYGNGNTSYFDNGTFITSFGGNDYFWYGDGTYYYTASSTGGTTTPTYINIGGVDYQNGTYDSGTASTTYYPYGDYITYYEGYTYYHDGNGSYYTG